MRLAKQLMVLLSVGIVLTACSKEEPRLVLEDRGQTYEPVEQEDYLTMKQTADQNIEQDRIAQDPEKYEKEQRKKEEELAQKERKENPPLFYIVKDEVGTIEDRRLYFKETEAPKFTDVYLKKGDVMKSEDMYAYLYYILALVGESNENFLVYLDEYGETVDVDREIQWFNDYSSGLLLTIEELSGTNESIQASSSGQLLTQPMHDTFSRIEDVFLDYRTDVYAHIREMTEHTNLTADDHAPIDHLSNDSQDKIGEILKREMNN